MIRIMEFPSEDVRQGNTFHLERILNDIEQNPELVREFQGTIALAFPDFEDAEVVFLVSEVKSFLHKVHQRVRHLWYYLIPHPEYGSLLIFMAVHVPEGQITIANDRVHVEPDLDTLEILLDRLIATARFTKQMAGDPTHVISQILAPLIDHNLQQQMLNGVMSAI